MDPWNILGWFAVAFCVAVFVPTLLGPVLLFARRYWLHRKTRKTPPRAGQVWFDAVNNRKVWVARITENGVIVCKQSEGAAEISWGDTPEQWENRVHNWLMFIHLDVPTGKNHV